MINLKLQMLEEKFGKLQEHLDRKFTKCNAGVSKNMEGLQKIQTLSLTSNSKIDILRDKLERFEQDVEKLQKNLHNLVESDEKNLKRMRLISIQNSSKNFGRPSDRSIAPSIKPESEILEKNGRTNESESEEGSLNDHDEILLKNFVNGKTPKNIAEELFFKTLTI